MDTLTMLHSFERKIQMQPTNPLNYEDAFETIRLLEKDQPLQAQQKCKDLRSWIKRTVVSGELETDGIIKIANTHKKTLLFNAPWDFDSYAQYIETNRDPAKRFYLPRRRQLYAIAKELQRLSDDELDLLAISLPPGVGKTTLAIFFLTWLGGKNPEKPILGGSHSNAFLRGVYDECLRVMQPNGEYLWGDVFPAIKIAKTNAMDMMIDLDKSKRFSTFEFTSIGSGNAGKVRAENLLYCDDLCAGIEEALSHERMETLWTKYTTDLRQRKIGNCRELHIATRWSVRDVIGRLERVYEGNERTKFIKIPAIDENEQSRFDYGNHAGFSTQFYMDMRSTMDDASWKALYMNEPIEREGLLYHDDELRRYYDLPGTKRNEKGEFVRDADGKIIFDAPDAIISISDTKDTGKDFGFMPIGYVYGNDYYMEDCVCTNAMPDLTDACLANMLFKHKAQMCRFESNAAGGRIADKVQGEIKRLGGITHITKRFTTSNKETRIIVNAQWVKDHCLFKNKTQYKPNTDYGKMMAMLVSFTMSGKNKNDDVPDGMAMFAEFAQSFGMNAVTVFQRPF